jgi:hypothetical protein
MEACSEGKKVEAVDSDKVATRSDGQLIRTPRSIQLTPSGGIEDTHDPRPDRKQGILGSVERYMVRIILLLTLLEYSRRSRQTSTTNQGWNHTSK